MLTLILKPGEFISTNLTLRQRVFVFALLLTSAVFVLVIERNISSMQNDTAFFAALILICILFYSTVSQLTALKFSLENMNRTLAALPSKNYSTRLSLERHPDLATLITSINDLIGEHERVTNFLSSCANETNFTAGELENESHELLHRAGEQSRRLESAASASEEMSVTVTQVSQSVKETHAIALEACTSCNESRQTAVEAVSEIETVAKAVKTTSDMLDNLYSKSNEIVGIASVIDEITRQIHLLALNAAIEAARAGVAGRGFAVVADEIQTLAGRTSNATNDITNVLNSINNEIKLAVNSMSSSQGHVNQGVLLVQNTHDALSLIEEGALKTSNMVEEMLRSIHEHAQASSDMAKSIEEISLLAQKNHNSSNQTLDMVHYLRNLSQRFSHREEIK